MGKLQGMPKNGLYHLLSYTNPTPNDVILHPILHPKSIVYKGVFLKGCRKCMFFSETFFVEKFVCVRWMMTRTIASTAPNTAIPGSFHAEPLHGNQKHRTSLKQTSVLSRQNIGTLLQRSPMFSFSGKANFFLFRKDGVPYVFRNTMEKGLNGFP